MTIEGEDQCSLGSEVVYSDSHSMVLTREQHLPRIQGDENEEEWQDQIKKSADFHLLRFCQPANDPSFPLQFPDPQDPISVFFSVTVPEISVSSYLNRWQLYSKCSPSTIIYAVIYLRRVEEADCRLAITGYTMHRLLTASILVAVKFLEEVWYSNAHYGRVGGMGSVQEINRLELEFLRLLNYRAYVSQKEFAEMVELGFR